MNGQSISRLIVILSVMFFMMVSYTFIAFPVAHRLLMF
ncbi:hypothetical protein MTR67_044184 [Solanum verrucosum]|uniref:Uncharacterized protein n=1 Tax=Solanum verrucosum TaxID=315347 RepID=A0AAF0URT7_SOLVR|nr:hypothetical protein MTR67_044184 [Solanum verrucosum]